MKILNKKGFTLVELLAVIVILAIVVGITLVTVLPTLKKSRQEAFELTAQTAADYFEKQYQLYLIGEDIPADIESVIQSVLAGGPHASHYIGADVIESAGLKAENYVAGQIGLNATTGRICVKLYASTNITKAANINNLAGANEAGEYYDATEQSTSSTIQGKTAKHSLAKSSACS